MLGIGASHWTRYRFSMRYYSAKADANQPEIVDEFRKHGAYVAHVHRIKNMCDLFVLYRGVVVAVEIKMPGKTLTDGEDKFAEEWTANGGKWAKVETREQARGLIDSIREHTR